MDAGVDAVGARHARWAGPTPPRIVSLVPSLTELLCDLGLASSLVGRTGWCIHPARVVDAIPKVGGTKTVNVEKIRRLAPTHLVVNVDENERPTVDEIAAFVPHVVVTHPQRPLDNVALYRLMGHVFDREREAEALVARLETTCRDVAARAWRARPVLYLIWTDPWMTVARDTYIAETLALVGWEQVDTADLATGGSPRYPAIDLDRAASRAGLVLLSSEPYRFTDDHARAIATRVGRPTVVVDGEWTSWYGSRAIAGIAALARFASTLA